MDRRTGRRPLKEKHRGDMNRLGHLGLTVSDMARSLQFYQEVAGFRLIARRPVSGPWLEALLHAPGVDLDMALLELNGFTLQLVRHREAPPEALALRHSRVGTPHLSIYVTDFDGQYARARAAGAPITSEIITIPHSNRRTFYVADPDGVPVEFVEATPAS